eukprot:3510248-Rhodomonas_salina.1
MLIPNAVLKSARTGVPGENSRGPLRLCTGQSATYPHVSVYRYLWVSSYYCPAQSLYDCMRVSFYATVLTPSRVVPGGPS